MKKHTLGLFLAPLIPCQIPPPIAPIENAPPKSFKMTYGLSPTLAPGKLFADFLPWGFRVRGDVPGVSSVISSRHDVLLDKKGPGDVSGQKSVFEIDFFPCSSVVDSQLWGSVSQWICVGCRGGDLKGDGFVMTRVMMTFWVLRVETRWKEKMGQKGRVE